jgi:hypothetical protein
MIHCKNCIHWQDESLDQIEEDRGLHAHIFMGCRIFGNLQTIDEVQKCRHYHASENLFTLCNSCHITVPKVCISLGECVNCTDTDLFCLDSCIGEECRKYCTHFVRLHTEGVQLIDNDEVFDLFPTLGMPGQEQPSRPGAIPKEQISKAKIQEFKPMQTGIRANKKPNR